MRLLTLGLNHKSAPVEVRERFSVGKDEILKGLMNIGNYGALEAVILSTCNRSEIYAVVSDTEDSCAVKQFMFDLTGTCEDIDEYLYCYVGEECVRHLLNVASSLDSIVIGEGQILSQVKEAYSLARNSGTTGTILNTLFHRAIAAGKRVRTETKIAYNSVSVSFAAVELAKQELNGLEDKNVLIFGAGKMANLTAKHLLSGGVGKIYVANRHIEKAQKLAETLGGSAVAFDEAMTVADADIIITSTGAPHYVVKEWETRRLMAARQGRPLFIVDIAVPRDVDPEVGKIKGVTLYNIDDLNAVVDEHIEQRQIEAKAAAKIVEEETAGVIEKFRYLSFRPLMALLSDRAERIRQREVRRVSGKLPDLTEEEWRQVNRMSKMIVRKILRAPMMHMNAAAGTKDGKFYAEAMTSLFNLNTIGECDDEAEIGYRYAQK